MAQFCWIWNRMKLHKFALLGIVQLIEFGVCHSTLIVPFYWLSAFLDHHTTSFVGDLVSFSCISCMSSCNSIVSFLTRQALSYARALSLHGLNFIVLFSRCNIRQHLLFNQHGFTCTSQIAVEWRARQLTEDDALSISVVFELLMNRSGVDEFADCVQVFDRHETVPLASNYFLIVFFPLCLSSYCNSALCIHLRIKIIIRAQRQDIFKRLSSVCV
jgi:hypothetical protein